jgi:hypothetical protein
MKYALRDYQQQAVETGLHHPGKADNEPGTAVSNVRTWNAYRSREKVMLNRRHH